MLNTEKDEQTFYFEMQKIYQNSMFYFGTLQYVKTWKEIIR